MYFSEIKLSYDELALLEELALHNVLVTAQNEPLLARLYSHNFAYPVFSNSPEDPHQAAISKPLGVDYLAYARSEKARHRKEDIRYCITTTIAVIALIKSFLPEISEGLALLLSSLVQ